MAEPKNIEEALDEMAGIRGPSEHQWRLLAMILREICYQEGINTDDKFTPKSD